MGGGREGNIWRGKVEYRDVWKKNPSIFYIVYILSLGMIYELKAPKHSQTLSCTQTCIYCRFPLSCMCLYVFVSVQLVHHWFPLTFCVFKMMPSGRSVLAATRTNTCTLAGLQWMIRIFSHGHNGLGRPLDSISGGGRGHSLRNLWPIPGLVSVEGHALSSSSTLLRHQNKAVNGWRWKFPSESSFMVLAFIN